MVRRSAHASNGAIRTTYVDQRTGGSVGAIRARCVADRENHVAHTLADASYGGGIEEVGDLHHDLTSADGKIGLPAKRVIAGSATSNPGDRLGGSGR